jgi:putative ABC transport system permease protein
MSELRQVVAVLYIGIGSLRERYTTAFVIVIGMACVVGVLTSMLSLTAGMAAAYLRPRDAARAIVWADHAVFDQSLSLKPEDVATVLDTPGIAKAPDGTLLADAEFTMDTLPVEGYAAGSLKVDGLGPAGVALRPEFKIVSGRTFRPGARELLVGVGAARKFRLAVGSQIRLRDGAWPVVGVFSCGSDIIESHLVGDAVTLMAARRASGFAHVLVQLASVDAYPAFQNWLIRNPALSVFVERTTDYDRRALGVHAAFFTGMAYVISAIMALGALFAVLKIMYGAVRARTREIGTLRAIGFGAAPVALSILLEAALLAAIGALIGAVLAWILFDGRDIWVWGAFKLHIPPSLWLLGLAWGVSTAVLGGLLPALRAGRLTPVEALRSE